MWWWWRQCTTRVISSQRNLKYLKKFGEDCVYQSKLQQQQKCRLYHHHHHHHHHHHQECRHHHQQRHHQHHQQCQQQQRHHHHHHQPVPEDYLHESSVYIHWPYCRQRCSYCNFVKFIPRPESPWTVMDQVLEDAMVREIQYSLQGSYITKVFSVYFGGGTPSLARPHLIQKVLQGIQDVCELDEKAEVTLEVNPTPTQTNKLQHFKAAGINRVSIGVQSLDNDVLRHLNRDHSVSDAVACINVAQQLFTGRVSLDAIFGLPNQTLERWRQDVRTIVNLCKDHLSLYQLTVEPGTQLYHQVKSGEVKVPCVDQLADMYEASVQMLKDVGLGRYEVSNFASNYSTQSRHNKAYWQASQYLGVGPGAHTRIVHNDNIDMGCTESGNLRKKNTPNLNISLTDIIREARVNACDPVSWLREVGRKGTGVRKVEQQTRLDVASEYLASGLRSTDGVTEARWSVFLPQHTLYDIFSDRAKWLQQEQLIILSPEGMKVSELGLNVLDSILPHLLSILVEKTSN